MLELRFPSAEEFHQFRAAQEYRLTGAGSELEIVEEELAEVFSAMFEEDV